LFQTAAAQLVPSLGFPVALKSKAAVFVKRLPGTVPREQAAATDMLIFGDLAQKPLEQLATLVDEVRFSLGNSWQHL